MRQAFVLAAGRGSRLAPLTDSTPKCLIEVGGMPLVDHIFLSLKEAKVSRVVVNLWHLGAQIREHLEHRFGGEFELLFSEEDELLDTGGGLCFAQNLFAEHEPILVHNSDILLSLPLDNLYREFSAEIDLALLVTQDHQDARALLFDTDSRLAGWRNSDSDSKEILGQKEEGAIPKRFCGVQLVSPRIFQFMPSDGSSDRNKFSIIKTYLDAAKKEQVVRAYDAQQEAWYDIGTHEQLERARKEWPKL